MDLIREPHRQFHQTASEMCTLIEDDYILNSLRIRQLLKQLATEADGVVGQFSAIIDESARAAAIYRETADLSQGRQDSQGLICTEALNRVIAAKAAFDIWDKGQVMETGRRDVRLLKWSLALALMLSALLAAIEEMSSMTSRNAESSRAANKMMTENASRVKEGFSTVEQMAAAMKAISQSSEEIGRIIKTIEDFFS